MKTLLCASRRSPAQRLQVRKTHVQGFPPLQSAHAEVSQFLELEHGLQDSCRLCACRAVDPDLTRRVNLSQLASARCAGFPLLARTPVAGQHPQYRPNAMRLSSTGELNPHSTLNRPSSARIMLRAQVGLVLNQWKSTSSLWHQSELAVGSCTECHDLSRHHRLTGSAVLLCSQSGGLVRSTMPGVATTLYGGQYIPERPWSGSEVAPMQMVR